MNSSDLAPPLVNHYMTRGQSDCERHFCTQEAIGICWRQACDSFPSCQQIRNIIVTKEFCGFSLVFFIKE